MVFKKHKRIFFLNRVGKIIFLHLSNSVHPVLINSRGHAQALYNYHVDNKLNYSEDGKTEDTKKE